MKKLAFTLTEILIALGIIGVMMALAVSIVKPREIQYKYQFQQAQTTLSDSVREAILRTKYTHHRFPKSTINDVRPVMQLCKGLNETLNTTRATDAIGNESDTSAYLGAARNKSQCKIETLNGMVFYIWVPGGNGQPICRLHVKRDDAGNILSSIPVASFVAFVDIDGKGSYYSPNKPIPGNVTAGNESFALGNLPGFLIDEDYSARPLILTGPSYAQPGPAECGIPIN